MPGRTIKGREGGREEGREGGREVSSFLGFFPGRKDYLPEWEWRETAWRTTRAKSMMVRDVMLKEKEEEEDELGEGKGEDAGGGAGSRSDGFLSACTAASFLGGAFRRFWVLWG